MSVEPRIAQRKKPKDPMRKGLLPPAQARMGFAAVRAVNLGNVARAFVALCVSMSLSFVTIFIPEAFGAEKGVGKLGSIIGKAYLVRDGNKMPAKKGMDVFATDSLVTEPKAVVKIQFADGGSFMAFENSDVKIEEYDVKRQGDNVTLKSAFDIAKGKVRFFVKPGENRKNDAKYKTKNAVMGIRGTSGFIDTTNPGTTQLVVTTGKVEVSNPNIPGQSVLVPANQMTDIVGNSAPTPPKPAPAELLVSLERRTEEGGGKGEGEAKADANAEEKKSDEKKDDEKKSDEKKSDEKKSDEKKPDEKKSDEKKDDEKKSDEKKPDEKKPDEKKPDEKKPDEKKPDEKKPDTKQESRKDGDSSSKTEQKETKSEPASTQGSSSQKSDSGNAKSENSGGQTSGKSSTTGTAAAPGQAGGRADAANSPGAPAVGKQDSAPPTIKRVTVFSQDGSSSVAVSDSSLSKVSTTIDTGGIPPVKGGAGGNAAPSGAAPAAPAAAVAAETRNVIKQVEKATSTEKVQEQIKTSVVEAVKTATTTAVEAAKPVATPPPPPPPTERNVKVKVVLPQ